MNKWFKRIALCSILAVAVVCMGIFVAGCDKTTSTDYVITVVYPDGTPVNGETDGTTGMSGTCVQVQLCQADDPIKCYQKVTLGTDGIARIKAEAIESALGKVTYAVHVQGLPSTYTADDTLTVDATHKTLTITLSIAG